MYPLLGRRSSFSCPGTGHPDRIGHVHFRHVCRWSHTPRRSEHRRGELDYTLALTGTDRFGGRLAVLDGHHPIRSCCVALGYVAQVSRSPLRPMGLPILYLGFDDGSSADAWRDTANRRWRLERLECHTPTLQQADGSSTTALRQLRVHPTSCKRRRSAPTICT